MAKGRLLWIVTGLIFLAMTGIQRSFAQMGPGMGQGPGMHMPRYDTSTEVTVKGTVEAVNTITGPRGWSGEHLTLKTDQETFDVHLGPTSFLKAHDVSFAKGDAIQVTGSKVKSGQGEALIAREVKKGDKTLTLRDAKGYPMWSHGGQRGMGQMGGPPAQQPQQQ
jgi:hypothetical protein